MHEYYVNRLAAERLAQCYEMAPPRVRQYLDAEIEHVAQRTDRADSVLELGCGYGRVMERLATRVRSVAGVDTSMASLQLGRRLLRSPSNCRFVLMNAERLAFEDQVFDVVIGIQNAVSAFGVDRRQLLAEAVRVTRPGGKVLFSSYTERFWDHRLEWFRLQAEQGLLGEIDISATGDGVIVCKDGFRATTVGPDEFRELADGLPVDCTIEEVDGSSLFCELTIRHIPQPKRKRETQ